MKIFILTVFLFIGLTTGKKCDETECPNYQHSIHYLDLKCEPKFKSDDECCPIYYNCLNLDLMQTETNKCFYKNRSFNLREEIPHTELQWKCGTIYCTCGKKYDTNLPAEFICVHNDCPEFFQRYDPNCSRIYALTNCCSIGKLCGDQMKNAKKCTVGNQTYIEGQKIYTHSDKCERCICNNGEAECAKTDCDLELHKRDELKKYCAPKYDDQYCCPSDFICPDDTTTIVEVTETKEPSIPGNTCKFGSQTLRKGGVVQLSNPKEKCTKCSCILPPLVTCYTDPTCK